MRAHQPAARFRWRRAIFRIGRIVRVRGDVRRIAVDFCSTVSGQSDASNRRRDRRPGNLDDVLLRRESADQIGFELQSDRAEINQDFGAGPVAASRPSLPQDGPVFHKVRVPFWAP